MALAMVRVLRLRLIEMRYGKLKEKEVGAVKGSRGCVLLRLARGKLYNLQIKLVAEYNKD